MVTYQASFIISLYYIVQSLAALLTLLLYSYLLLLPPCSMGALFHLLGCIPFYKNLLEMEIPRELGHCFLYPLSHSSDISGWIHKAWLLARSSMLISVSWERILVFADSLLHCWSDQFGDVTDKSCYIVRGIRGVTRGAIICFWDSLQQKNAKECRILYQALRTLLGPFPHSQTILP